MTTSAILKKKIQYPWKVMHPKNVSSKIKDSQSSIVLAFHMPKMDRIQILVREPWCSFTVVDSGQAQQIIVKVFYQWVSNIKSLGHNIKISVYLSKILCLGEMQKCSLIPVHSEVAFSSIWLTPSSVFWMKYRDLMLHLHKKLLQSLNIFPPYHTLKHTCHQTFWHEHWVTARIFFIGESQT